VASFKATLEEARQAQLLLHVVDASNPGAEEHIKAVNKVLAEIGCEKTRSILVLNKIDRLTDRTNLDVLRAHHPKAVAISGLLGEGLDELREAVIEALTRDFIEAEVRMDAAHGKVLAYLTAHADIIRQEFRDNQVRIRCRIARPLLHHLAIPGVEIRELTPKHEQEVA
jgi:GTP-binding protein HflX